MASPFGGFGVRPNPTQQAIASPIMARYQNIYRSIMAGANPMQAIQQMVSNNPQIMNLLRQGKNPEGIFREMARQKGIDPDAFIKALQGR